MMPRKHLWTAVVLCGFAVFVGCSHTATTSRNITAPQSINAQPAVSEKDYIIQAGDELEIKFFYNPELNERVAVRPDGRFSMQLANEIMAAGLTPGQLGQIIVKAYSSELQDPEVTVIVRTFTEQRIYVDGEVNRPGLFTLTGQKTVLQAISEAGGLKDSALKSEVVVIRRSEGKEPIPIIVDLDKALNEGDKSQDLALMPSDMVYVPKSSIGNINKWVDMYIRKNIPISMGMGATLL